MKGLSPERKQEITNKIQQKIQNLSCPMCHKNNFILGDAYIHNILQENLNGIAIGGPSIPAIPIICSNCGFISQHAIGVLGLFPMPEKAELNQDPKPTKESSSG
jgi:hypothetical protein